MSRNGASSKGASEGSTPVATPPTTPSDTTNGAATSSLERSRLEISDRMENIDESSVPADHVDEKVKDDSKVGLDKVDTQLNKTDVEEKNDRTSKTETLKKSAKASRQSKKSAKKRSLKKASKESEPESASDDSDSDDSSSDSSSVEEERKSKRKAQKRRSKQARNKARRRSKRMEDDSDDEDPNDSSSESSSEEEAKRKRQKRKSEKKRRRKGKKVVSDDSSSDSSSDDETPKKKTSSKPAESENEEGSGDEADQASSKAMEQLAALISCLTARKTPPDSSRAAGKTRSRKAAAKIEKAKSKQKRKSDALQYKRVDQLWDSSIHNYKLKESAEDDEGEFAEFAFLVRRKFDWENKYTHTVIDIKSKQLRAVLVEVMKECKSVSLEAEEPIIDPNLLFLYLEHLRKWYRKTVKSKIKAEKKRKVIRKLEQQRALCKTLVGWIDEDYADTKKTLYPLLEAGNITFDLLWALFNPNEVAITSCYGSWDEPRCFKVDYALKYQTMTRGEWYCVEGKYMEYDGKNFGYGDFEVDIEAFKGPRKITSLATYPLKYHKDPEGVKKLIIERGEKFVAMDGMQYKFHKGLAFMKKKKQVLKISINSRVMVDPATFRRINPNYPISLLKPKDDDLDDSDSDDDESCGCGGSEDEEAAGNDEKLGGMDESAPKYKHKWVEDDKGDLHYVRVEVDENGDPIRSQRVDQLTAAEGRNHTFTKEELLLTSPVVVGFAFSEKLWLEFSLSGVHDIVYNENAFSSLVLPPKEKSIVRALVESHKFHAAKTIDDVIQGKGKGLVAVLHGPPGTGKTLTAEGISELLKCPLYMVSAGELGTDPARLEHELQKILDIAHSWGAVLLLDEADVFLERRESHDIHRNALVSIFLRLLEYFQGILFLTTNRVESFDDAFQSRIHLALRYSDLDGKAKIAIWNTHLQRVRESSTPVSITDHELQSLARHNLNGRQIKNAVRTAQALALSEQATMKLEHIKRVLEVQETFDRDLKGGTGYLDAMRSYT